MSVHVLRCPNCGADLDVVEGVETIRCKFCGARSHVEGAGSGLHLSMIAKQMERIEGHAARTAAELEAMRTAQARGLASQHETDDAMRRAASAQEAAAKQAAFAARLAAEREIRQLAEEAERIKRDLTQVQDAERKAAEAERRLAHLNSPEELEKVRAAEELIARAELYGSHESPLVPNHLPQSSSQWDAEHHSLLQLRSRYRWSRVLAFVGWPFVMIAVVVLGVVAQAVAPNDHWLKQSGGVWILVALLSVPLYFTVVWSYGTALGRKFNDRAFLYGLPNVRVKSREQAELEKASRQIEKDWEAESRRIERDWKRSMRKTEGGGFVGCLVLVLIFAVGVYTCSPSERSDNTPHGNAAGNGEADNGAAENSPKSNGASANEPRDDEAPPANGEGDSSGSNQSPD
jgi:hypothetical protein